MRNPKYRHILFAACAFVLLSIAALWSFNTLADLFGGPTAQYKHAMAGVGLLIILKRGLFTNRGSRNSSRHDQRYFPSPPENVHEQ